MEVVGLCCLDISSRPRFFFGFFLLELPIVFFSLAFLPPTLWRMLNLIVLISVQPLIIGGLAGLFYGNASPKDQDWGLSKTLVALYRISSWVSGKRDDDVTTLSLGDKDNPEE